MRLYIDIATNVYILDAFKVISANMFAGLRSAKARFMVTYNWLSVIAITLLVGE